MNYKLTLTSLVLAAIAPLSASAGISPPPPSEPVPGEIGNVTFALAISYETSEKVPFKTLSDTTTRTTVIKTDRYSNPQLIADLISRYGLPGAAAEYTIRFVKSSYRGDTRTRDGGSFAGYFLVRKGETSIVYLGSESNDESETWGYVALNTYGTTDDNTDSEAFAGTSTTVYSGSSETNQGSFNSINAGPLTFTPPPFDSSTFECSALAARSGAYSSTYTADPFSYVETNRTGATRFSSINGTDYNGNTLTGTITIAALKSTANVSAYLDAYNRWID